MRTMWIISVSLLSNTCSSLRRHNVHIISRVYCSTILLFGPNAESAVSQKHYTNPYSRAKLTPSCTIYLHTRSRTSIGLRPNWVHACVLDFMFGLVCGDEWAHWNPCSSSFHSNINAQRARNAGQWVSSAMMIPYANANDIVCVCVCVYMIPKNDDTHMKIAIQYHAPAYRSRDGYKVNNFSFDFASNQNMLCMDFANKPRPIRDFSQRPVHLKSWHFCEFAFAFYTFYS